MKTLQTDDAQQVPAEDLKAGMVLVTGIVLRVDRDDINSEVRLAMPGANVHFADFGERVTVLARVSADVLDAVTESV